MGKCYQRRVKRRWKNEKMVSRFYFAKFTPRIRLGMTRAGYLNQVTTVKLFQLSHQAPHYYSQTLPPSHRDADREAKLWWQRF